jgi:hypothetical protein
MARIVIYDPAHENERVTGDLGDRNTLEYLDRVGVDAVIDPDTSGLVEPDLYWRHDAGAIRDMDSGEKAALDAEFAAVRLAAKRDGAVARMDADSAAGASRRAMAALMIDELNILRERERTFQTDVAAANNLADLKAAVAAYPVLNDRTLAQAITKYKGLILDGTAD